MANIPRIPEVLPSEVIAAMATIAMVAPPPDFFEEQEIQDAADRLPEGKRGFLKITYEFDQHDKKNEVGVALVHKFNDYVSVQAYGGYEWGGRRGAKVKAELLFEW